MNSFGYSSRNGRSSRSNSTVSTVIHYEEYKTIKFKITLYSAAGTVIQSWTGTAIRHENGVCKFYNAETGTLVQVAGTVVIE